jgi:hypothetical protein
VSIKPIVIIIIIIMKAWLLISAAMRLDLPEAAKMRWDRQKKKPGKLHFLFSFFFFCVC